jgi:hypothetical protein
VRREVQGDASRKMFFVDSLLWTLSGFDVDAERCLPWGVKRTRESLRSSGVTRSEHWPQSSLRNKERLIAVYLAGSGRSRW